MNSISQRALERMVDEQFGSPLILNVLRGTFTEYLIAEILGDGWSVSPTWDSWDLEGPNGERVEIKSSSILQSWHTETDAAEWASKAKPSFDIKRRTGRWEGDKWIAEPGRAANLYIFAMHEEKDFERADHKIADQWVFYVANSNELPVQKTISLGRLKSLFGPVKHSELLGVVNSKFKKSIEHA